MNSATKLGFRSLGLGLRGFRVQGWRILRVYDTGGSLGCLSDSGGLGLRIRP